MAYFHCIEFFFEKIIRAWAFLFRRDEGFVVGVPQILNEPEIAECLASAQLSSLS